MTPDNFRDGCPEVDGGHPSIVKTDRAAVRAAVAKLPRRVDNEMLAVVDRPSDLGHAVGRVVRVEFVNVPSGHGAQELEPDSVRRKGFEPVPAQNPTDAELAQDVRGTTDAKGVEPRSKECRRRMRFQVEPDPDGVTVPRFFGRFFQVETAPTLQRGVEVSGVDGWNADQKRVLVQRKRRPFHEPSPSALPGH